jgi:hypothetical protein
MPADEPFEEKVIRLLESILKRLSEIEDQLSVPQEPQDYGEPI